MNTIAEGTSTDLLNIGQYESAYSPGDGGILHIETSEPVDPSALAWFQDQINSAGITLWGKQLVLNENGNGIDIYFDYPPVSGVGIAPLVLLAAIIGSAIALAILALVFVVVWKLMQIPADQFTPIIQGLAAIPWILGAAAVLLGGVLIYRLIPARSSERAA